MPSSRPLGVGFIGSGFITRFHIRSWEAVRGADVRGVFSPDRAQAEEAAALARQLRVGDAKAFGSIEEMVSDPAIDCVWVCGPNHARVENLQAILAARQRGADLVGIAIEKPLARNVAEAKTVRRPRAADRVPARLPGRPALLPRPRARARDRLGTRRGALRSALSRTCGRGARRAARALVLAGRAGGGGVLTDMMCHSVEVCRYLLTKPGAPRHSIRPVKVSAQIASLKWSRPEYAERLRQTMGPEVDYRKRPSEDFARATIRYVDEQGTPLVAEATTGWSYVGAGLRLSLELLGPEYSLSASSLDSGARVFFSRHLQGDAGEDLVEKQNAEQGLMPVVGNEAAEYGYEGENRFFVRCFADGIQPELDARAGLEVVELLMTCYLSAEQERVIDWKPDGLESFVPAVARGAWKP